MSKAFTKDDAQDADLVVPARAPLPTGIPNYVTPRGLRLLQKEHEQLHAERTRITASDDPERARRLAVWQARIAELETRLSTAQLVPPAEARGHEVHFGARVTVRTEAGEERRYQIVGVDEADIAHGLISFIAPLARALIGKRPGELADVKTPRTPRPREEELEIVAIDYPEDAQ